MKVKMLTAMSGPAVQRNRGDELDLPNGEATSLIKAGFAQAIRDDKRETTSRRTSRETTSVEVAVDTTSAQSEQETAATETANDTTAFESADTEKAGA